MWATTSALGDASGTPAREHDTTVAAIRTAGLSLCNDRGLLVITHDTTALENFDRVLSL